MPHARRISADSILATARQLLERAGPGGLTMRALARELDVRAPSLYFYVESRDDLLAQLIRIGLNEFGLMMQQAATGPGSARERAGALARAYIAFAESNPQLFTLVFGPCLEDALYPREAADQSAAPVIDLAAGIVGGGRALFLAEALWSLVHGYTVLRLAEQFRANPEHEQGLEFALDLLIEGALVAGLDGAR